MDFMTWARSEWDRILGYGLVAAGGLALVLGFRGVSESPYVADALSYLISGALGGLFLLGFGATVLVVAELRDEWRKLDELVDELRATRTAPDVADANRGNGADPEQEIDHDDEQASGPMSRRGRRRASPLRAGAEARMGVDDPRPAARTTASFSALIQRLRIPTAVLALGGLLMLVAGHTRSSGGAEVRAATEGAIAGSIGVAVVLVGLMAITIWLRGVVRRRTVVALEPLMLQRAQRLAHARQRELALGVADGPWLS